MPAVKSTHAAGYEVHLKDIKPGCLLWLSKKKKREKKPRCISPHCSDSCIFDPRMFDHPAVVLEIEDTFLIFGAITSNPGLAHGIKNQNNRNPNIIKWGSSEVLGQLTPISPSSGRPYESDYEPRYKLRSNRGTTRQCYLIVPHKYKLHFSRFTTFVPDPKNTRPSARSKNAGDFRLDETSLKLLKPRYSEKICSVRHLGNTSDTPRVKINKNSLAQSSTPSHDTTNPTQLYKWAKNEEQPVRIIPNITTAKVAPPLIQKKELSSPVKIIREQEPIITHLKSKKEMANKRIHRSSAGNSRGKPLTIYTKLPVNHQSM